MLLQSKNILNSKIFTLHTGQSIGQITALIINPHKLEVVGFYCQGRWNKPMVLLAQDVRQVAASKVIIDSADEITATTELHRLQEILEINYNLIDKPVRTESKRRLGKIEEYVVNADTFLIQKLYVKPSVFKSLMTNSFVVERQQVVEVSDAYVTVSDATMRKPALAPQQV